MRYADNLPIVPNPGDFAYIVSILTGKHYITALSYGEAVSYIQTGQFVAVAAKDWTLDDGTVYMTRTELQKWFNSDRRVTENNLGLEPLAELP